MSKKVIIISLIVIALIVVIVLNLTMKTSNATKVQADVVEHNKLTEIVSASGRIQPQTKVDITSEVTGEIIALKVKEGNFVTEGQLLVILDTVQLQSDLDQARYSVSEIEARLDGTKAYLDQAKVDFEREQKLLEKNQTSEKVFDQARYNYLNADASYKAMLAQAQQARARLEKQEDNLSKAKIVAPMPGIITYLDCEVGEIAPAQNAFTQGKTLMTISNLEVFEVEVEVDETEINKVELNQRADIEVDAFIDTVFAGKVIEIGNTAVLSGLGTQDQSTNFKVKVIFNDPNVKIRPGMSATVDIITNSKDNAMTVPYSAIVMRMVDLDSLKKAQEQGEEAIAEEEDGSVVEEVHAADKDYEESDDGTKREEIKGVFIIKDGKAKFVQVSTGIADQKNIEVTEGLNEGDTVVSGPYRILRTIRNNEAVEILPKDNDKGK